MAPAVRGTRWCFTLNNYNEEDVTRLKSLVEAKAANFIIFGKEVAPETGTPHLQGYLIVPKRLTATGVKKIVGNAHMSLALGTTEQNVEYCSKGEDVYTEGTPTKENRRGARCDLEEFKDAVKDGTKTLAQIREEHSMVYAKYQRFCVEYVMDHYPEPEVEDHPLKKWQSDLNAILNRTPDDRTVVFIVDPKGNCGKTWFTKHYSRLHDNVQRMKPGKKSDMAYILKLGTRVLFMDAPRSKQGEFIQYDFLEELKDGFVQSGKYESCQKKFEKMHVVVFMNEMPDMGKLSRDRYKIIEVNERNNVHVPGYIPNVTDLVGGD